MISLRRGQCVGWPLLLAMLAACSNGSGSLDEDQQPPPTSPSQTSVTIGGTVVGLAGGSVVLQNNGAGDLTVTGDGPFTFDGTIASGANYNVAVPTQPTSPAQTCTVANGSGVATSNVTNVVVTCSTTPRYTVGVRVSGLNGAGLVLQNGGADDLPIPSNGTFVFNSAIANGSAYSVTVRTQPSGQNCVVSNPTGTIAGANVSNIEVACAANQFTIGGSITGLTGSQGAVLTLNGGNDLKLLKNGDFAFSVALAPGATYAVAVKTQPTKPAQECLVATGTDKGVVGNSNVTSVSINCTVRNFVVRGVVSNLQGDSVLLLLNGTEQLRVTKPASPVPPEIEFQFKTPIQSGATYAVTRLENPKSPTQDCTTADSSGTIDAADVKVRVNCSTVSYKVGGRVIGLLGSDLRLKINGWEEITVAGSTFEFPTRVASGSTYAVQISHDPTTPVAQGCSIEGGNGTVGDDDVENIVVTCRTTDFAVGGSVSGLLGSGLRLANGNDQLPVTVNGPFAMGLKVPSGADYNVTVISQPSRPEQDCVVTDGAGKVGAAPVDTISVQCTTLGYLIGVSVSGLRNSGLRLSNNGTDVLPIASDGLFYFKTPILPGGFYNVVVASYPEVPLPQYCQVLNGNGTVIDRNVETIRVDCL